MSGRLDQRVVQIVHLYLWSSSEVFTTLIPCVKPQNPNTTNITLSESLPLNWDVVTGAGVIELDIKRTLVLLGLLIQQIQIRLL